MPETALVVQSNLSHNVPAAIEATKNRLTDLAKLYLTTEVAGQSQATLDAKHRDLKRFLAFYHQLYGHDRPEEWFVSVTKAFLKQLRGQRFAQDSLVRVYATVRHFACWLDRTFPKSNHTPLVHTDCRDLRLTGLLADLTVPISCGPI
jgi:site-specific recombinase XerD